MEFRVADVTKAGDVSLTTTTGTNAANIRYALNWAGPVLEIRENGVYAGEIAFANNDLLKISVESGVVKYYKNGVQIAHNPSPAQPAITYPLKVNVRLLSLNAQVTTITFIR